MEPSRTSVLCALPGGAGWRSTREVGRLMARLLSATFTSVELDAPAGRVRKSLAYLPRFRRAGTLLVIAGHPANLDAVLAAGPLLRGYATVAGWVIDSWWDDRIPHVARGRGRFDHLFLTEQEVLGSWAAKTDTQTSWLPQGADVLPAPLALDRPVDLRRIGRQPAAWDDDERTAAAAAEHGVTFAGRPGFGDDSATTLDNLRRARRTAKFTLAFSPSVAPGSQTHPSRDYLTGRWTDSLGDGAGVAGVVPRCATADELLWPGATTEVDPRDLDAGMAQVRAAVDAWTPQAARVNHRNALERLDWRWRAREVADRLGLSAPVLDADLARLRSRIADLDAATRTDRAAPDDH